VPGVVGPNRARVGRPVWPSIPPSHNNELSIRFGRTHTPRKRLGRRRRLTHHPSRDACIYRQCRAASHPEPWLLDLLLAEQVADRHPRQPAGQSLSLTPPCRLHTASTPHAYRPTGLSAGRAIGHSPIPTRPAHACLPYLTRPHAHTDARSNEPATWAHTNHKGSS
jgi:hypothetical protein